MTARVQALLLRFAIILAGVMGALTTAQADEEDSILVLDASGSMWGQIDGEAKIVTARRVIGQLLENLPADRRLGLVAYGHNRKGDCADIEEIAPVGTGRSAIRAAMQKLNPKGKTPLSAAVKFAAEKLRHTENKATVILVSDGEETCDLDPCAVGTELEEAGVDFTAHVIGFDIAAEHHRAQLQCLAENTGGVYLNASNADELAGALNETVAKAPEPAKETGLSLRATELSGGPVIESGLNWRVAATASGNAVFTAENAGAVEAELPPGTYDIFVERPSDNLKGEARGIELRAGANKTVTIPLELTFEAMVKPTPSGQASAGSEVSVEWTGPNRQGDYLTIVAPDAGPTAYNYYAYTREGSPLKVRMPLEPGNYEVRYVLGRPAKVLARAPITATPVDITLSAPATVAVGADFEVTWTGPGYQDDWITIVKPDAAETAYMSYAYTRTGNPVTLRAPVEPGAYELRYVLGGNRVAARTPIAVSDVAISLSAPDTAMAGTRIDVAWTGPGGDNDWITVTAPSAPDTAYTDYKYTREGNPVRLRMPLEPGDYELRYVLDNKKVVARRPIRIVPASATLEAPSAVIVGATVAVRWTGPAQQGDFITVTAPNAPDTAYTSYAYPRNGNPLELVMPVQPGTYEFRYVLDGKKVIARKTVAVRDADASISGPASVKAGASFQITWTGPANRQDFVTIVARGAGEGAYTDYAYARNGSPASLRAPASPGDYELRYVLNGARVIARSSIKVTAD